MRLLSGADWFFLLACVVAFGLMMVRDSAWRQVRWSMPPTRITAWKFVLTMLGLVYLLAWGLKLDMVSGFGVFLAALLGTVILASLNISALARGILLLLGGAFLFPVSGVMENGGLPLLSALLGLLIARVAIVPELEESWLDLAIPASWLIGVYWIGLTMAESLQVSHQALLQIFMGLSVLLTVVRPLIPVSNPLVKALFVTLTGGLAAWLAVQTLLVQPGLLRWVWLFAGALALGDVLQWSDDQRTAAPVLHSVVQLALIGVAALAASRLFGTLGWIVIVVGLLPVLRLTSVVSIAVFFLLGRTLLQGFSYAHNPNVTGINITHPYASAALYTGLIAMLLLPEVLNTLAAPAREDATKCRPLPWSLLLLGTLLASGLANYFLHAEATGSLLVATTVGSLGVSVLGASLSSGLRMTPLLLNLLIITGALLFNELIQAGNEADKIQKMVVMAVVMVVLAIVYWLMMRGNSRCNAVEVA